MLLVTCYFQRSVLFHQKNYQQRFSLCGQFSEDNFIFAPCEHNKRHIDNVFKTTFQHKLFSNTGPAECVIKQDPFNKALYPSGASLQIIKWFKKNQPPFSILHCFTIQIHFILGFLALNLINSCHQNKEVQLNNTPWLLKVLCKKQSKFHFIYVPCHLKNSIVNIKGSALFYNKQTNTKTQHEKNNPPV